MTEKVIRVTINPSGSVSGAREVEGALNRVDGAAKRAQGGLSALSRFAIGAVGGVLAGLIAGGGLLKIGLDAVKLGNDINTAASKASIGGKAMSELAHAAKQSDVDIGALSTALRSMQVNLSKASEGSKEQVTALRVLGLTFDSLKGMKPEAQFELLADRISKIRDPADKARAATEIFGRAGEALLPMFEKGAAGIRAAREEANKLGVAFSDEQLKKLADADKAIKQLKASWQGFATALTADVAPALTAFFKSFDVANKSSGEIAEKLAAFEKGGIFGRLKKDEPTIAMLRGALTEAQARERAANLAAVSRGGGSGVLAGGASSYAAEGGSAAKLTEVVVTAQKVAVNGYKRYLDELNEATRTDLEQTMSKYRTGQAQIVALFEEGRLSFTEYVDRLAANEADVGLEEIYPAATRIKKEISKISEFAKQAARSIQTALADFLFNPFESGVKGMVAGFLNAIRRMVAELAASKLLDVAVGGGFGKSVKSAAGWLGIVSSTFGGGKEKGGALESGKWYIAGEKGPEPIWGGGAGAFAAGYGGGGSNLTIAPVYHMDNRGASMELMRVLPQVMESNSRRTVELARAAVRDDLARGRLGRR